MKITQIKTYLMQVGVPSRTAWASANAFGAQPFSTGITGTRLIAKVFTDTGIVGIGECSGWRILIETAVQDFKHILIGEDPTQIERLWQRMMSAIMVDGMTGTIGAGVMTGIDMALWDIKGKALGVPVWHLLGGQVRDKIRIYSHANTPEAALSLKARGITAIKCGGVSDPVRKVAALRDAVGDDMDIMIDLHGPPWLTPGDPARLAPALEPYHLLFIKDPIAPDNLDGYQRIRDAAHVPLAAGERALIERDLVDVIQPDTGRAGGITQMKKIAAMAEAHHIMMAPHSGSLGPAAEYASSGCLGCGQSSAGCSVIRMLPASDAPGANQRVPVSDTPRAARLKPSATWLVGSTHRYACESGRCTRRWPNTGSAWICSTSPSGSSIEARPSHPPTQSVSPPGGRARAGR